MTDARFGALDLPVALPIGTQPAGDPALLHVLAFAAAVLRAETQDAWAAMPTPKQTLDVVHTAHPFKIEDTDFNEGLLPALYVWREEGQEERLAADYVVERSTVILRWVSPPRPQDPNRRRTSFVNAIGKALAAALRNERHPAWVVPGDPDPRAATQGSLLWSYAGFWSDKVRWRRDPYQLDRDDTKRGADAEYDAVRIEIETQERHEPASPPALTGMTGSVVLTNPSTPGDPAVVLDIETGV